jgi:hypothetical protein
MGAIGADDTLRLTENSGDEMTSMAVALPAGSSQSRWRADGEKAS